MDHTSEYSRLQAVIQLETAHRKFNLWWKLPQGFRLTYSTGNPLVASLTPICMALGERLHLNEPVSPILLNKISQIQSLYSTWLPSLKIIPVEAPQQFPVQQLATRNGCFFSGGVDSFYSLLTNDQLGPESPDHITDLLFVAGFDIPLRKKSLLAKARNNIKETAAFSKRRYLEVQTNLRRLSDPILSWNYYHGAAMASVGLLCSPNFRKLLIPSSFTLDQLHPWGSHPDLDPLWSTETLQFIHDDCRVSRNQKIINTISKSDLALKHLRVCWKNYFNKYNCGTCEKCLRTMIALHLGTGSASFPTFPKPLTVEAVRRIKLNSETALTFARENQKQIPDTNEFDLHLNRALTEAIEEATIKFHTR